MAKLYLQVVFDIPVFVFDTSEISSICIRILFGDQKYICI